MISRECDAAQDGRCTRDHAASLTVSDMSASRQAPKHCLADRHVLVAISTAMHQAGRPMAAVRRTSLMSGMHPLGFLYIAQTKLSPGLNVLDAQQPLISILIAPPCREGQCVQFHGFIHSVVKSFQGLSLIFSKSTAERINVHK